MIRWRMAHSLLLIFLLLSSLPAQEKLTLSVDQCIQIGLERSKSLHASLMNLQLADARASEVHTLRLPSLRFAGVFTRLSDVPPFEVTLPFALPFPSPNRFTISPTILDNYNFRLTLQQPLFTGMRLRSSSEIADLAARSSSLEYERDKRELVYSIRGAYWSLSKAVALQELARENADRLKSHLGDAESSLAQGLLTKSEVLRVQVQYSAARLKVIEATNAVQLAVLHLNSTIGLPLSTGLELSSKARGTEMQFGSLEDLIRQALLQRAEAQTARLRVQAGEVGVTLARSAWFPQVFINGNYQYARPNPRILPAQDKFADTWDVGLSVSLDIWNWGSTFHQTDQAQARLQQAQDISAQLKDGITLEVTQAFLTLGQSKERIAVAEQGVQQAEESYRITNERFKRGVALNSELLDAEVALLEAQTNYTHALIDSQLAQARLQKAVGED